VSKDNEYAGHMGGVEEQITEKTGYSQAACCTPHAVRKGVIINK
jgi:hypothetical protein